MCFNNKHRPHNRLICKIRRKGIGGNILKWIEDFLLKRTQKVKVNDVESENVEVSSGVPQGSVLGPLLFLIYIDDLPCKITSSCQIFADDKKIYGPVSTATHQSMQKDINHMMQCLRHGYSDSIHPQPP